MINNQQLPLPEHLRLIPSQTIRAQPYNDHTTNRITSNRETRLRAAQEEWRGLLSGNSSNLAQRPASRRRIVLTTENQLTNNPWGDPLQAKLEGITRIFSLNANGLSLDQREGQYDELCKVAKEVQADVLCCQEHNLDTTQSSVRRILYDTTRQHWSRSRVQFSSTPIPFSTQYKPGGTMIMIVDQMSGRIQSQTTDHLGRWASYTLRGRDSRSFTIISIYQVVTDAPRPGTTTAAAQQQSLLLHLRDPITTPRKAFKRDLWQFVEAKAKQGEEILIVGDFNEVFGSEIDGISKLAADFNMVNLMKARHSGPLPATLT